MLLLVNERARALLIVIHLCFVTLTIESIPIEKILVCFRFISFSLRITFDNDLSILFVVNSRRHFIERFASTDYYRSIRRLKEFHRIFIRNYR
jgi:hypothetical protein